MQTMFWLCVALVFYVYVGYPALLLAWRRLVRRPVQKACLEPSVSIVIAAHNEREYIEAKLNNCLALDYPKSKLQIIVSLDGPTDGSEFLVWKYVSQGIELVYSKTHAGKATALNRAVRQARGEIVVFADARQILNLHCIRALVAGFADQTVGAVSGELLLMDDTSQESATDVGLYWRYEKAIRSLESDIHSLTGVTGAIYAIRSDLYEDLPEDTILDDVVTPLRIVLKGKRTVFEPEAKAYDTVACCAHAEYRRKVRTLCGNYQLLARLPEALIPLRNPVFIQFLSHKVGRLLVPWALLTMLITNLFLMTAGLYVLTFALQLAWYMCAAVGCLISKREASTPILISRETRKAA